jgi:hypothetical protein
MQSIIQPPIKIPISDYKAGGIVNVIWNQFFIGLYKLFSQPSYGYKDCTISVDGISGEYETDYKWISDRDFIHFYITITPTPLTKIGIKDAKAIISFNGNETVNDKPLKVSNISISLLDGNIVKDFRTTSIDESGQILIPNAVLTRFTVKINGTFIKAF